jgi:hypothetical protein
MIAIGNSAASIGIRWLPGREVFGSVDAEPEFESAHGALGTFDKRRVLVEPDFFSRRTRRAVSNCLDHSHHERNRQGKGNLLLLFPVARLHLQLS